ncbi:nucleotidyl transferase AbiEii/AbiGii toxin family protein [Myroides odoratimimus]|uniref:Nucleotidyltransferase n=2 Tax=Flavobacteriaceae TaxID=49546 RepID=A0AAI8G5M3_9FLAO|nr:nucleotidyl transferase AbiEii/AbiGii toxin family protein [Myroides odoratimimus]ALU27437.1 hypothetical protein AS202_15320 [Myroides odoratimimus]
MDYKIESKRINHPLIKPILEYLIPFFQKKEIKFYIIGATARDIILELHNEQSGRATRDLDIAIAIEDWDKYAEIENDLVQLPNFKKDTHQKQRFIYLDSYEIDLVPYGEIMQQDDKIYWPPDEETAMNVLGFKEAEKHLVNVSIDNQIEVSIVNLASIFLLKSVAWSDRNITSSKDADDIGFILTNYLSINQQRAIDEFYDDIYTIDPFDTIVAAGTLMGIDLNNMIKENSATQEFLSNVIDQEIKLGVESRLFNQIIETNKTISFDQIYQAFIQIKKNI